VAVVFVVDGVECDTMLFAGGATQVIFYLNILRAIEMKHRQLKPVAVGARSGGVFPALGVDNNTSRLTIVN